ncbi:hypothetical protein GCM10009788_25540 [Nocardioides humi]|uniref:Uncharacterized protein n=1 Tax=Nocardioides humi TaxID=449461 RepID=A0ABN2AJL3_9ACTN
MSALSARRGFDSEHAEHAEQAEPLERFDAALRWASQHKLDATRSASASDPQQRRDRGRGHVLDRGQIDRDDPWRFPECCVELPLDVLQHGNESGVDETNNRNAANRGPASDLRLARSPVGVCDVQHG